VLKNLAVIITVWGGSRDLPLATKKPTFVGLYLRGFSLIFDSVST
jgi:hypothetical protein